MNYDDLFSVLASYEPVLTQQQRKLLAQATTAKVFEERHIEALDGLLGSGRNDHILCVAKGRLAIDVVDETGRRINIFIAEAGQRLNWLSFLPQYAENYSVEARFVSTSVLYLTQHTVLEQIMAENPVMQKTVLKEMHTAMEKLLDLIHELAFFSLEDRLWKYLTAYCGAQDKCFLTVSHEELAAELGVSREAISRALARLAKQERVVVSRKKITVLHQK